MIYHRCPKLTLSENEELDLFTHIGVTAVRVGTWPFILRSVTLHESRWEFERFIGRCMGNKISLICNANYSEIFTFFFSKMMKKNSPLVCPLCFLVIFPVLGFLCHHCSSLHKTESRQHTRISTVVNSEAVWVQKIHPIGIFSPTFKAGVNPNLIEIIRSLKGDWKEGKRLWNTTRQLPDPTMAPQVVGQLFGVYLPIFNFKLQPQIFKISYFHKFF